MNTNEAVEAVAIALSMADPDERGLPDGWQMAPFYRMLAQAALAAARPIIMEEAAQLAHSWPSHALTYDEPPLFRDGARWAGIHIATAIRTAAKTDGAAHDR